MISLKCILGVFKKQIVKPCMAKAHACIQMWKVLVCSDTIHRFNQPWILKGDCNSVLHGIKRTAENTFWFFMMGYWVQASNWDNDKKVKSACCEVGVFYVGSRSAIPLSVELILHTM